MSASKVITVGCDYKNCKVLQGAPLVISWSETEVSSGRQPLPELAKYLVILEHNGVQLTFCCQLHAAEHFLPPGYEAKQKDVVQLPNRRSHHKKPEAPTEPKTWMDEPQRVESPVNGRNQADGFGPEESA